MITKKTAYDIWVAYDEIEKAEALLKDMNEQLDRGGELNLRDAFGRQRCLQLGVPSSANGHRLFDVQPSLAVTIIRAHAAIKQSQLEALNELAKIESNKATEKKPTT